MATNARKYDIFELELLCLTLERSDFLNYRAKLEHSARLDRSLITNIVYDYEPVSLGHA